MSGTVIDNTGTESGLVKGLAAIKKLASDPASPTTGQMWYNTTSGLFKGYNGSATVTITTS